MDGLAGSIDSIDIGKMAISFCLSTPIIDRSDDIVEPNSITLKNHQTLPYLCFNHQRLNPIGRCDDPETKEYLLKWESSGLMGKAFFAQTWDSEWLFDKVVKGLLNGMSPGFIPKSFKVNPESKKGGRIYTVAEKIHLQNELLEASLCVNGDNPEAHVILVEKCLKEEKLPSEWVIKNFQALHPNFKPTTMATVTATPPPKINLVNKSNDDDVAKDKPSVPGEKALRELHKHYIKAKALCMKHVNAQEKESPVRSHLEEQDKALDELRGINKALHDERYKDDYGELEDVEGDSEEVSKNLMQLASLETQFKQFQYKTNKQIRDLETELKKYKSGK